MVRWIQPFFNWQHQVRYNPAFLQWWQDDFVLLVCVAVARWVTVAGGYSSEASKRTFVSSPDVQNLIINEIVKMRLIFLTFWGGWVLACVIVSIGHKCFVQVLLRCLRSNTWDLGRKITLLYLAGLVTIFWLLCFVKTIVSAFTYLYEKQSPNSLYWLPWSFSNFLSVWRASTCVRRWKYLGLFSHKVWFCIFRLVWMRSSNNSDFTDLLSKVGVFVVRKFSNSLIFSSFC